MHFKGKNSILRTLEPSDLDWLFQTENDEQWWHLSNTHQPYSRHLLAEYIQHATQDIYEAKQLRLVIEYRSENAGLIDLFDFDPFHKRAGVGILVHKEFQNKGIGSESLTLLIQYAFNYLKLHQLFANISADNSASLKLFEKQGFVITGTKKDWNLYHDKPSNEHFLQLINPYENRK